jgi:hypothetical protein
VFAVVPVAVAIMTPIPLILMYIYHKCSVRWNKEKEILGLEDDDRMVSVESTNVTEPYTIGIGNIK